MKIIKLYTAHDNNAYFAEIDPGKETEDALGYYSQKFPAKEFVFRIFETNTSFDWHNAPTERYFVYLEGEVEIETSGGEKRVFKSGDILYAADISGKGHFTRVLKKGFCLIITP